MTGKFKNPLHSGKYRNNPCPCGSGKKNKKCHGKNSTMTEGEREDFRIASNNHIRSEVEKQDLQDLKDMSTKVESGMDKLRRVITTQNGAIIHPLEKMDESKKLQG